MAKMTCPECSESIEIPDDPRTQALLDAVNDQQKTLGRFAELLEDLGKKVTVPKPDIPGTTVKRKKGDSIYEGVFFTVTLDEDEDDDKDVHDG